MMQPIFVVGTPRSGTTLTAKILGKHSTMFMPGETHFFDDIYARMSTDDEINDDLVSFVASRLYDLYDRYYETEDQNRIETMYSSSDDLTNALSGSTSYAEILSRYMTLQMDYVGKQRWGNNAPRDLFSIDDILSFYPEAKIIVCVRDVRAFLLSYKGKWKITGDAHTDRLKKLYHPVITSLLWKASMKLVPGLYEKVPDGNLLVVKYEDLVTVPETVVRSMCDVIGEKFEPEMLNVVTHNSSNAPKDAGIFSTSIERWKTELSPEEIEIAQQLCSKQLTNLGYDLYKTNASFIRILIRYLSTPYALIRALDANKEMRGPLLPYLFRRITALFG